MIGVRVLGKKPIAALFVLAALWGWSDLTADTIYQQIRDALDFIGGAIFIAVLVWFVDSQQNSPETTDNTSHGNVSKNDGSGWSESPGD